jgi:hypothetical protein
MNCPRCDIDITEIECECDYFLYDGIEGFKIGKYDILMLSCTEIYKNAERICVINFRIDYKITEEQLEKYMSLV